MSTRQWHHAFQAGEGWQDSVISHRHVRAVRPPGRLHSGCEDARTWKLLRTIPQFQRRCREDIRNHSLWQHRISHVSRCPNLRPRVLKADETRNCNRCRKNRIGCLFSADARLSLLGMALRAGLSRGSLPPGGATRTH